MEQQIQKQCGICKHLTTDNDGFYICNKDIKTDAIVCDEYERRKGIYISGKISGLPIKEARKRFAKVEAEIKKSGHFPINPLKNRLPESATYAEHMKADLFLLLSADTCMMLKGWEKSKGASLEKQVAEICGIEVIYE